MEESVIKIIHESMKGHLNERQQRLLTASMANVMGYGGISALSRMTGMSRTTITSGRKELETPEGVDIKKVRRGGGGRKKIADIYSAPPKIALFTGRVIVHIYIQSGTF